uniref:Phosphatidylserine synthase n=1 Tax=Globodera pallida TaxID=36090 RepID=A0A183C4D5_GLOPA
MNNNERTGEGSANRGEETDLDSGDEASEDDRRERARRKYRHRTYSEFEGVHFKNVNERVVSDITLEAVYKPHTLAVLVLLCAYLIYAALTTGPDSTANNVYTGLVALFCLFVVISAMVLPNGPFIRPHPIFWRVVFDVKAVLSWLDPVGLSHRNLSEKMYAENCSDVTLARVWSCVDIFAFAHFTGWAMKALLIRHSIICWYISIWWELTEIVFSHMLPNFQECWWDAIVLDVLLCNGLGIACGLGICRWLEMRQFHWESIKNIRTFRGKLMRSVMQFTPESWITVNWLQGTDLTIDKPTVEHKKEEGKTHISMPWMGVKRCFAIYAFIMVWLTTELNIFFTKHVLVIDTSHPLVFGHIIFIGLIAAPTIRQYYMYVTDPMIKRMGMQCWLYVAICALEAAICVKFGRAQLPAVKLWLIMLWILFLAIGTFFCVWVSVWWAKYSKTRSVEMKGGGKRECYSDSSTASHSGENPSSESASFSSSSSSSLSSSSSSSSSS